MSGSDSLRRQLGLADAVALFVGIILGSGIFRAPAAVAAAAPSAAASAGLWILGGAIAACGAFCYAECGARLPRTGGFYVFYREAFGEGIAFVGGWAALLVTYPASIAAIALIFAEYLGEAWPAASGVPALPAAAAVAATALLNAAGVRAGALAQRVVTGAKVLVLAVLCLAAPLAPAAGARAETAGPPTGADTGLATLLFAVVVMLWTYDGWTDVTLVSGELRNPGRNLGRTVIAGTAVLVLLYTLVQVSVGALLAPERAAASERVFADAVEVGLGVGSGRIVALLVVVCTLGSINGIVLTASRLGYAMARDGTFFSWFGAVHPRFETPARSVGALAAATLAYVFVEDFRGLLEVFSFSVWIFYGLTAVALLRLRRRGTGEPPGWRAPGGVLPPAVVLATAAGVTSGVLLQNPRASLWGLLMLAAGYAAYRIRRSRTSRPADRSR